jgi:hypothetical protein
MILFWACPIFQYFFYDDGSIKVPPCKKKKKQFLGSSFAVVVWSIRVMEDDAPCGLLQKSFAKTIATSSLLLLSLSSVFCFGC